MVVALSILVFAVAFVITFGVPDEIFSKKLKLA